jgi:hypothetical protein
VARSTDAKDSGKGDAPSPGPTLEPDGVYRTAPERPTAPDPPRELVYDATDVTAGRSDGALALFRHVSLPAIASVAAAWVAGSTAGAVALVSAGAFSVWSWRTRGRRGGAVLTVERGVLVIEVRGGRVLHDRVRLGDLADVTLDVKTIERVVDSGSAIPAMRFIDSRVAPKVDTARLVLVRAGGRELPLTTEYLSHLHATEWLGRVRSFLRKHGWEPEREREGGG